MVGILSVASSSPAQADLWGPYAATNNAYWGQATTDVLRVSSVRTNENGFWEAALLNYGQIPWFYLDGQYGTDEFNGTVNVQRFWRIGVDGQVGPQTWTEASRWTHTAYYGGQTTYTWFPFGSNQSAFTGQQIVGGTFAGYWGWSSCYANGGGFMNTNTTNNAIVNGHWCGP
jgi:hypothetical protein